MRNKTAKILFTVTGLILLFVLDDILIAILIRKLEFFPMSPLLFSLLIFFFLGTNTLFAFAVYRIIKRKPVSGVEGIIGEIGLALTPISTEGTVTVHGEIWKAESQTPIAQGENVKVIAVEGLVLKVISND